MTASLIQYASKQEASKQANMGTRASVHFKGQQNMQLRMILDKPHC
jgi:hypothetical protein